MKNVMLQVLINRHPRISGQFTLPPGTHALFGASGSGKTTLFRILAGVESSQGMVRWNQEIWQSKDIHRAPYQRALAFVPQYPSLVPHRTLESQLRFVAGEEWMQRAGDWVDILELSGLLSRSPGHLSGGEQQRAGLLRAIVTERSIWLLDEALSQIDRPLRTRILAALRKQRRPDRLILFSSHDWDEIESLADKVVVINQGQIYEAEDTGDRIPKSPEEARLLGYIRSYPAAPGQHYLIHPRHIIPGIHPEEGPVFKGRLTVIATKRTVQELSFESPLLTLTWSVPVSIPIETDAISLRNPPKVNYTLNE